MVVGEIAEGVDFLVVGGGPGGYAAALHAAREGREVTLVDRDGERGVGGVCLRVGCIPSKALIEAADAAHRTRHLAAAGLDVDGVSVDLGRFQEFKRRVVDKLTGGVRTLMDGAGVQVVAGELRFTRPDQAVIEPGGDRPPQFVEFRHAVIATGSRPVELPGLPRDGETVLDSTDALALERLPESLAVVGGGYIGLELGTAFAKLGSNVTLVEALDRVLPTHDPAICRIVQRRLADLGVDVHTGARARDHADGKLTVERDGQSVQVEADRVVVAVGRQPNTDDLGLERLGVKPRRDGLLDVQSDRGLTPHIAAIGDITPGPALAHKATAEAETAVAALCGRPAAFDPAAIPAVVFSDPEVAGAGLSGEEARAAGIDARVATFPLGASGRAATLDASQGFLQLVIDPAADVVVGVHVVAPHASELIGEGVLAIEMAASPEDLAASIHPHPTLSEMYAMAAQLAVGRPLHTRGRPKSHSPRP